VLALERISKEHHKEPHTITQPHITPSSHTIAPEHLETVQLTSQIELLSIFDKIEDHHI